MSGNLNRITIMGHVGADPKYRCLESGKPVCDFRVAINELGQKQTDGTRAQGRVTWVSCTAWDRLAETVAKYVRKGSSVYLEGKLQNSSYTDKDGIMRYGTKVVAFSVQLLDKKPTNATASTGDADAMDDVGAPPMNGGNGAGSYAQEEDIPF